jgi:hypothetical protein
VTTSDAIGFLLFSSWGLWWLVAPESVIRFYAWFHQFQVSHHRKLRPFAAPKPIGIRIAGLLWLALIVVVEFFGR